MILKIVEMDNDINNFSSQIIGISKMKNKRFVLTNIEILSNKNVNNKFGVMNV
jgi:hypothetical protein